MVRLINIGHNGLDIEVRELSSGYYLSGDKLILGGYLLIPHEDKYKYYFGKLTMRPISESVQLTIDGGKKDFWGVKVVDKEDVFNELKGYVSKPADLEWLLQKYSRNIVQVHKDNVRVAFGQGALNSSIGQIVFDEEVTSNGWRGLDIILVSLYYCKPVEKEFARANRKYFPISEEEYAPINVNITQFMDKEKITLRSRIREYSGDLPSEHVLNKLQDDDALFINSVKDTRYSDLLLMKISEHKPHVYIYATSSMLKGIGSDRVKNILGNSEVYFARFDELEAFFGIKIDRDVAVLIRAMKEVKSQMKDGINGDSKVYVTFDDKGAFVLDERNDVYYHPVSKSYNPLGGEIKNTNGCGDAFGAIATYLEFYRTTYGQNFNYTSAEILGYASIAGQIKARMETACGNDSATSSKINSFMNKYSDDISPVRIYDKSRFASYKRLAPLNLCGE